MTQSLACRNTGGRRLKKYSTTITAAGGETTLSFTNAIPAGVVGIGAVVACTLQVPSGSPQSYTGIPQQLSNGAINVIVETASAIVGDHTLTVVVVSE